MASGNVLFKLLGQVFVDTDEADKSMSKTTEKAESMADKIGKGAKTVGKIGAVTVATATAVTGALISNAKSTSSTADEIDKASIRMGISAEKYQELGYVAEQTGVEMSVLEKAAKKLEGTDINMDDAIESIMSLQTAEERSAKASELFGNSIAYSLSPMIAESSENFNGLIDRAHQLGLVMSDDAVASGVQFNDLMSDMQKSVSMLSANLGSALMPVMNELISTLIDNMPQIQSMISELAPVFADLIKEIVPPLLELIQTIMPLLIDGIEFLVPVITKAVTIIEEVVGGVISGIKSAINGIISGINAVINALSIDIPDWIPVIGGKSLGLKPIPMLASGGEITGSGTVLVGEKGPELLNLPSGASVVPLSGGGNEEVIRAIENMTNSLIVAMRNNSTVVKVDDPYKIFKLVKDEERKYNTILGKA